MKEAALVKTSESNVRVLFKIEGLNVQNYCPKNMYTLSLYYPQKLDMFVVEKGHPSKNN